MVGRFLWVDGRRDGHPPPRAAHEYGPVDGELAPIKLAVPRVELDVHGAHDALPGTVATPEHGAVIDRLPEAIAVGNITPRHTRAQFPEQAVHHPTVVSPGMTDRAMLRKIGRQHSKLGITQPVAAHLASSQRDNGQPGWSPDGSHHCRIVRQSLVAAVLLVKNRGITPRRLRKC